jgi:hypothetical protein
MPEPIVNLLGRAQETLDARSQEVKQGRNIDIFDVVAQTH